MHSYFSQSNRAFYQSNGLVSGWAYIGWGIVCEWWRWIRVESWNFWVSLNQRWVLEYFDFVESSSWVSECLVLLNHWVRFAYLNVCIDWVYNMRQIHAGVFLDMPLRLLLCVLSQVSTHGYSQNQILVWKYPSLLQIAKLTGHSYRVLYLVSAHTTPYPFVMMLVSNNSLCSYGWLKLF